MNLREDKGYTYGARSYLDLKLGDMPWVLSAAVQADKTVESLVEARREMEAILSDRPVTQEEFEKARDGIVLRYPQNFETQAQLAQGFGSLWVHGLRDGLPREDRGVPQGPHPRGGPGGRARPPRPVQTHLGRRRRRRHPRARPGSGGTRGSETDRVA